MPVALFDTYGTIRNVDKAILEEAKSFASRLKSAFGDDLISALLFGSFARGTGHVESDVDIALILTPEGKASFSMKGDERSYLCDDMELASSIKLGAPISLVVMDTEDVEREIRLQTGFFKNLVKDAVDLLA